jgi:hypothetical protein
VRRQPSLRLFVACLPPKVFNGRFYCMFRGQKVLMYVESGGQGGFAFCMTVRKYVLVPTCGVMPRALRISFCSHKDGITTRLA